MRVAWFPKTADLAGNPYWPLLQRELEALGVEFETSHNSYWTQRRWLLENRKKVQVLHFHFIQPQYAGASSWISMRRLAKFASDLVLARLLGYRIVWTLHDLMPTWPLCPQWLDLIGRYLIAGLAQDVIVHCSNAHQLLKQRFQRSQRVWITPHPAFPTRPITKAEARASLGLSVDCTVIAFIGGIRPNKGIESLIEAFTIISDPKAVLVIAGKPWKPESYVESVLALSAQEPRIRVWVKPINHEELQVYSRAADITVLPFKTILTSSSTVLAMSCGCPVVVPRLGCLPELVGSAGILYDVNDPQGLKNALEQALSSDLAAMGASAHRRVSEYTWQEMAQQTARVYGLDILRS